METLAISILILSWHSPKTLRKTLSSYQDKGLLSVSDDIIIFFQEVSDMDLAIAEEFGITNIVSSSSNIGIGPAIVELVKASKYNYFLFLEEDWALIEDENKVREQLEIGTHILWAGAADVIKLRSRFNPGDPLYTIQFKGRERDCAEHMGESIHWIQYPEDYYPDVFSKFDFGESDVSDDWYLINSKYVAQTNNPCLHSKEFYMKHIAPFSGVGNELEGKILEYWQKGNFKVSHSSGLFKHERWDR